MNKGCNSPVVFFHTVVFEELGCGEVCLLLVFLLVLPTSWEWRGLVMMLLLMREIWRRKGRGRECAFPPPWISLGLAE